MGVRTPELRGIAKDLKKSGWREYIKEVSCAWKEKGQGADGVLYDEMIIWGLCICGGCRDWDTAGEYVTAFVPAINNWAVCDIFCGSLKITGRYREEVWQFIQPYFQSGREYDLRFGTVMLLSHYTDQDYLDRALKLLDRVRHPGYYAKMAVAWAVSVYFVKFPDQVMEYLKQWCGRCEGGADTPLSSPKTCATIKLILRKVSIFTDKPELLAQQLEKGAFLWGI